MADAKRDNNRVTTLIATSSVDGTTPVLVYADPTTHRLKVDASATANLIVGTSTITSGTTTKVLFDNAGVVGEYTISGSGNVAMTTSPVFTTPNIGSATGSISGNAATVTTNANLTGVITSVGNATSIASQTGTGTKFVVDTSPTLVTPVLGVASVTSINKVTITAPATSATLTITDGKTATINNTLTLAGTDSTTMTFPSTSATIARTDAANTFTGVQTFSTPIATGSVATMTATVGGGVPTPPNNTTTFLRGDGTFAAPTSSSGLTRVGGSAGETTTVSTSETDVVTISGLSIAAGTRVRVTGKYRKTTGAAVGAGIGLKINATGVITATTTAAGAGLGCTDAGNAAENGNFWVEFEVGETNYASSIQWAYNCYGTTTNLAANGAGGGGGGQNIAAQLPSATITSVIITGISGNSGVTLAIKNVQVYTYANS